MAILVRKIERNKWMVDEDTEYANADVFSKCLFTQNNELSFWRISSPDELDLCIAAMVSGQDHIQRTHVVLLSEIDLQRESVEIVEKEGVAASPELAKMHRDLAKLNAKSMLSVSSLIVKAIKNPATVRTLSERQVKEIMQRAFDEGRFVPESLKPDVRKKLDSQFKSSVL